jgi:uncharacterized SAM-binding protein YcdF (DUF218 family)
LPQLVYPVGLVSILILVALVVRRHGWQKALLAVAFLALFVGGNHWVALGLAQSLEWRYLPPQGYVQADAIVILAGDVRGKDYPRAMPEIGEAGDRLFYAAQLYRQGAAPFVLHSGGSIEWLAAIHESQEDPATLLEALGVPAEAQRFELDSRNTYESAIVCRELFQEQGVRKIFLVTSASHMPRSVGVFQRQGIDVIPAPTDYSVTQADWEQFRQAGLGSQLIFLIPSADNLEITTRILKEYIGLFVYKLRGWL